MLMQITDDTGWKKLLSYYVDCLRKEGRLPTAIAPQDIRQACWFLPHVDGGFMRNISSFSISMRQNHETEIERLRRFVLGESDGGGLPHLCFGYPFYVDADRNLTPIFYVGVSGRPDDRGVRLTSTSAEMESNLAALVKDGDEAQALFAEVEAESGRARFDRTLELVSSRLQDRSGKPIARVSRKQFDPQQLPPHAIVECPLLFCGRAGETGRLAEALEQLAGRGWDAVRPSLRQLLAENGCEPVPEPPELAADPHLYVVPPDDGQRQASASAAQRPLTVVAVPPGVDRSGFILNVVGDAVLRGETVLVASSGAVDAIFGHLSDEFDYPGVVKIGQGVSAQMAAAMQALATTREDAANRMEQARGEYDEVARQIDEPRDEGAPVEQLERERETCQTELQAALDALPESVSSSVQGDGISFDPDEDDGRRLDAATGALLGDVQEVIAQRQALAEEARGMLLANPSANQEDVAFLSELEDVEQFLADSTGLEDPGANFSANFSTIDNYISAWDVLLQAISVESDVRRLQAEIDAAQSRAQSQRQDLPADLAAVLDDFVETFDGRRAQSLQRGLWEIENEAREAITDYRRLVNKVGDLRNRSELVAQWLLAAAAVQVDGASAVRLEDILDRGFAIKDDVLEVYRLSAARVDLAEQSQNLQQDCDVKVAELEGLLSRLSKEFAVVGALTSESLLSKVGTAIEAVDHEVWRDLAAELAKLDMWASRVAMGSLTFGERLRKLVSGRWAVNHLRGRLRALGNSNAAIFALNPVAEPPDKASFKLWADYVRVWNSFAQVCALSAHRNHVARALAVYQVQSGKEITASFSEAQQAETQLADLVARLPETFVGAMAEGDRPFGPFDQAVVRDLDELSTQYAGLKAQYADWKERLAALGRGKGAPRVLQRAIRALPPGGKRRVGKDDDRTTLLVVLDLVSTWLNFSRAVETEYRLKELRPSLAQVEASPDEFWARLPDGAQQKLDWSRISPSDDVVQSLRQFLLELRMEIGPQVEEWEAVRERAIDLAHQNKQKDVGYLAGLLGEARGLEQLLDDLQTWRWVVRVWRLRGERAQIETQLAERLGQDEDQSELDGLWERRRELAGQMLVERWRRAAAEMESDTVQSIEQYLAAIEAGSQQGVETGHADAGYAEAGYADAGYAKVLKLFPVWLSGGLGAQSIPLEAGLFDCVVVDDACGCDIASALPLLFRGKRIVVVGGEPCPPYSAALPGSVSRQLGERHGVGEGSRYDRSRSLFDLATGSVAHGPGRIVLGRERD